MIMGVARMRERLAGKELCGDHKNRCPDDCCQSVSKGHGANHIKNYGGSWRSWVCGESMLQLELVRPR
jgi:hypothetical protein